MWGFLKAPVWEIRHMKARSQVDTPVALQSQIGRPSAVSNLLHVGGSMGPLAASLWSIHRLAVRCIAQQQLLSCKCGSVYPYRKGGHALIINVNSFADQTWCG